MIVDTNATINKDCEIEEDCINYTGSIIELDRFK